MSSSTPFWTSDSPKPGCVESRNYDLGIHGNLDSGNSIPLLWSSCFSGSDINVVVAPEEEWCSDDEPHYLASWDTEVTLALGRLDNRMPSILKIAPASAHELCLLFRQKLAVSSAKYLHLDCAEHIHDCQDVESGIWKANYSKMLDGLDEPVIKIREGFLSKILGPGLPQGWDSACFWAMSCQSPGLIRTPGCEKFRFVGTNSAGELQQWIT